MSKNYTLDNLPPEVQRWIKASESLQEALPHTEKFLNEEQRKFQGLSIFPSDRGGYLLILRKLGDDGVPYVMYNSAADPLTTFVKTDVALQEGKWFIDKKSPHYDPSHHMK